MSALTDQAAQLDRQARIKRDMIYAFGDANQTERYNAGLLPVSELLLLARTVLFAPFGNFPRYEKIDAAELKHERDCRGGKVSFVTREPESLTGSEWSKLKTITTAVSQANQTPLFADAKVNATVEMVEHVGTCHACAAEVFERSASIRMEWAGHRLAREYTLGEP